MTTHKLEAAIDANAPLQDDAENGGPIDSDEEKDSVLAAVSRSHPQPLITRTLIPTKTKYRFVRIKEMLSHALGGSRGGGLFSPGPNTPTGRNIFDPMDNTALTSPVAAGIPPSET